MENNERAFGAIFSPPDVRDYQLVCSGNQEFPKEFELKMRRVKNQKDVGGCVSFALSEGMEYYNYIQNGDDSELSTAFIYGNRRNSSYKGEGMIVRDALGAIAKYGTVPEDMYHYLIEVPKAIELFEAEGDALFPVSYPHRITEYVRLNDENSIKLALMAGFPVPFAISWFNDMRVDKDGVLHTDFKKNAGGHCMLIYGWNETGWKVLNSWGENWGNKGRFIYPYEYPITEAWAIVDDNVEGIVIKKPYKTKIGKLYAKVANKIRNIFK